jgi:hypothetical protein
MTGAARSQALRLSRRAERLAHKAQELRDALLASPLWSTAAYDAFTAASYAASAASASLLVLTANERKPRP